MKTKITLLIAAIVLTSLSFAFSTIEAESIPANSQTSAANNTAPVGGFIADEILK